MAPDRRYCWVRIIVRLCDVSKQAPYIARVHDMASSDLHCIWRVKPASAMIASGASGRISQCTLSR